MIAFWNDGYRIFIMFPKSGYFSIKKQSTNKMRSLYKYMYIYLFILLLHEQKKSFTLRHYYPQYHSECLCSGERYFVRLFNKHQNLDREYILFLLI